METVAIEKWIDLCGLCEKFSIGTWIFRGVPDRTYLPRPVIGRKGARVSLAGVELPFDPGDAAKMLRQFKLRAKPYTTLADNADDLEWLSLARHHGLPTQLLDWTTSPLIAGYFACREGGVHNGSQTTAAIFGLRMPTSVESMKRALEATEPVAYFPSHVSPRIVGQHGLLTFHQDPSEAWEPPGLIRFDIVSRAAIEIKVALAKAGIGPAVVMPGLDGLAEDLGWQYKRQFLERIHQSDSSDNAGFSYEGYTSTTGRAFTANITDVVRVTDSIDADVRAPSTDS